MFEDIPTAIRSFLCINGKNHALTSELIGCFCDQIRIVDRC